MNLQPIMHHRQLLVFAACLVAFTQTPTAFAQLEVTPNYRDVDIRVIIDAAGEITGRTFIIDPRVNAKVTMLSTTPMGADAFYEAFLSILQVHNYVAVPSGSVIKILPDATARQLAGAVGTGDAAGPDDIVTQVIQVQNVGAAQLVPILRPLVPQYGHLVAHPGSNMLVISDRAANVTRMVTIIRRIDLANDEDIEVVRLSHASSAEIVRILTQLTGQPRADGAPVNISLVADARTNSVLIGGDKAERLRLRALIAHLDTPLEDGGDTQVRYLRYADAEELAAKLQQHFTAQAQAATGQAAGAQTVSNVSVWADIETNAIIVNAPPKMMRSLMQIVDKLDIRRAQVQVEAIIVEVTTDKKKELGVTWAIEGAGSNTPIGVTNFDGTSGVVQIGTAIGSGGNIAPSDVIGEGITLGLGRISDSGVSFAAILNALQGDADTNIISTPSIVTLDNEEASLSVGQEVPFLTGSFSNTGSGSTGGAVNPFQTIQRQQIGVSLTITPQINEGDSMMLKISQEISSLAQSATNAVDLITNQRTIDTNVIVKDGEILVLGGLLEDQLLESDRRVPVLGRIPLLGNLFRARKTEKKKTNLLVFIRPKILRTDAQTSFETNAKYNYIRDVLQGAKDEGVQLMPNEERLTLPPIDDEDSDDESGSE